MKSKDNYWFCVRLLVLISLAALAAKVIAATPPPQVHLLATDPSAAEAGLDPGTFTVFRTGPLEEPLTVTYQVGGTAQPGLDYARLTGEVTIPAQRVRAPIHIYPLDDNLPESVEMVVVALEQPPVWPPPYVVCWPSVAVVTLEDDDTIPNQPPHVRLVNPPDGAVFAGPVDITLVARAWDMDGHVRHVEFFADGQSLGIVPGRTWPADSLPADVIVLDLEREALPELYPDVDVNLIQDASMEILPGHLFRLLWSNAPPGSHTLTALATDNRGATTLSDPVAIRVTEPPGQPVVHVIATDPMAAEPDFNGAELDTAVFEIGRSGGDPTIALPVFYRVGGMAINGLDYTEIPQSIVIPSGQRAATIVIEPRHDLLVEGPESVSITLLPPVCIEIYPPPPDCYQVGRPDTARAVIVDNDPAPTNHPPGVRIVRPMNGDAFLAPADIQIVAVAADPDGHVVTVQFFEGTNSLGTVTNEPTRHSPNFPPFALTWTGVPPGHYVLTAEATDDRGATSVSRPIEIQVANPCPLPVVTLQTVDPFASELEPWLDRPPDLALFRVCRSCSTNEDLTVAYEIGGTASNGEDYLELSGTVFLPAGTACADILIDPIDDALIEGTESVMLRLLRPDCLVADPPTPGCYLVGSPSTGTAYIRDNDFPPNQPPKVALISPPDGATFIVRTPIRMVAAAEDADGWVETVEFFANGHSLGIVTNHPWILDPIRDSETPITEPNSLVLEPSLEAVPIPVHPFFLIWSNAPPGWHVLTALATDNHGAVTTSDPVRVQVTQPPVDPIVTVIARDPVASEGCPDLAADCVDSASFYIRRTGDTTWPLRVFFRLWGTAINGLDYQELPNSVVIPAGANSCPVVVEPIDDLLVEGTESVVLSLVASPCLDLEPSDVAWAQSQGPLPCYHVGRSHTARAVILDNDTPPNQPPLVRLIAPEDGDIFRAPADIRLAATAFDLDGQIVQVEFFEGTNSLGIVTTPTLLPAPLDAQWAPTTRPVHPVYELIWSDVPAGQYVLTAIATDNGGGTSISEPGEIQVVEVQPPPVVNIEATDPVATEQSPYLDSLPDTATFVVSRSGSTQYPLTVFYQVSGTASNGVDYERLPGRVTISAGASSAEVLVLPIDDTLCEGRESVRLSLVPHPCLADFPPTRHLYVIGPNHRARAVIYDDDICPPNQLPRVAMIRPQDNDVFLAPADILLCAKATDPDGQVVRVDFFANSEWIGSVVHTASTDPELFCLFWRQVPAGTYLLTALATDNQGAQTRSDPVRIRVIFQPPIPIVHLRATDPVGSEDGDPAAFTVTRSCCTNASLTVHYSLSGSADNGLDYDHLSGELTLAMGQSSARIHVRPIDDRAVEGTETVVARLLPSPCPTGDSPARDCYLIGYPAQDVVFLRDNDSAPNQPPLIGLLSPPDGALFGAPAQIPFLAAGIDPDGWIPLVEFFAGTNKIGEVTIHFLVPPEPGQLQTFEYAWANVPPGQYSLTAKATDNRGASTVSAPVSIRVLDSWPVPVVAIRTIDALAREGTTNTALFRIGRLGATNEALTVYYSIGGTAENGLDYRTIPDAMTIPAGRKSASIVIDPLADRLDEGIETVVLRLILPSSSTSSQLPYVIGRPGIAAAIIVDFDQPRPPCGLLAGRLFHVCLPGTDGSGYRLEASDDLADWIELSTSIVVDGAVHFVDPEAPDHPGRFYRVVPESVVLEDDE